MRAITRMAGSSYNTVLIVKVNFDDLFAILQVA